MVLLGCFIALRSCSQGALCGHLSAAGAIERPELRIRSLLRLLADGVQLISQPHRLPVVADPGDQIRLLGLQLLDTGAVKVRVASSGGFTAVSWRTGSGSTRGETGAASTGRAAISADTASMHREWSSGCTIAASIASLSPAGTVSGVTAASSATRTGLYPAKGVRLSWHRARSSGKTGGDQSRNGQPDRVQRVVCCAIAGNRHPSGSRASPAAA